jgi:hypothetical protein
MKFHQVCSLVLATLSVPAIASTDFSKVQNLSQSEFAGLAKDFTAAASYKGVAPAEALGIVGFDVGVEVSSTDLQNADVWKKAGYDHTSVTMPKLHVHKGLPFNIDVGASIIAVPGSDIKLVGAEIKYAIIEGGTATPAFAVRGAMTRLYGVSQLDLETKSVELLVSKGFLMLTPYAGIGKVWGSLTPNVSNLKKESPDANKVFLGLNVNFGLANLAAEVDRTGKTESVSAKLGFRF